MSLTIKISFCPCRPCNREGGGGGSVEINRNNYCADCCNATCTNNTVSPSQVNEVATTTTTVVQQQHFDSDLLHYACYRGDTKTIEKIYASFPDDVKQCLNTAYSTALYNRHEATCQLLLRYASTDGKTADRKLFDVDQALQKACDWNSLPIAELLVQYGASTTVGLRHARSPNIIKMLYRYEQNTENKS